MAFIPDRHDVAQDLVVTGQRAEPFHSDDTSSQGRSSTITMPCRIGKVVGLFIAAGVVLGMVTAACEDLPHGARHRGLLGGKKV